MNAERHLLVHFLIFDVLEFLKVFMKSGCGSNGKAKHRMCFREGHS